MSDLVTWAVYRSLDTRTNAQYDLSGMTAPERLDVWRSAPPDDEIIVAELVSIYSLNPSMRGPDEPIVVVKSDYQPVVGNSDLKVPALWTSIDDPDPVWKPHDKKKDDWVMTKPTIFGDELVSVVRRLIADRVAPTIPGKKTGEQMDFAF